MGWRYKDKTHSNKRKKIRQNIPFKRVGAVIEVASTSESFAIRVFLNDISDTGIGIFSSLMIPPEEKVSVQFTQPTEVSIPGIVVWCAPVESSHKIVSSESFLYRVGIQFNIEDPEVEKSINLLLDEVSKLPQS